jgi:hypothetical protein
VKVVTLLIRDARFFQRFLGFVHPPLVFAGDALEAANAVVLRLLQVLLHLPYLAVAIFQGRSRLK